jgi:hypothetical protein
MGRVITEDRREQIANARAANPKALGPALAELIMEGNIPVEGVAILLAVSEPTIYRWMYGDAEPRDADKRLKIQRMLTVLRKAKRAKDTPLSGNTKDRVDTLIELAKKHSRAVPT